MLHRDSVNFVRYFFRAYPRRSALMVALLIVSGVVDGVGIFSLVPLLQIAGGGAVQLGGSGASQSMARAFGLIGLKPTIGPLLLVIIGCIALKSVLVWLAMKQVGYTVARVGKDLRLALIRALLQAQWRYFGNQSPGRYANAIGAETNQASNAYREACAIIASLLQTVAYVLIAVTISWQTTLAAILTGLLIVLALKRFIARTRRAARQQKTLRNSLAARLVDALQGIKAIKAMAREDDFLPMLEAETHKLNRAQERQVNASETMKLFQEPVLAVTLGLGLYVLLGVRGDPLSEVLVMALIFHRLLTQFNRAQLGYQQMVTGEASFWSVRRQTEAAAAEREELSARGVAVALEREIRLDDIYFAYGEREVLRGASLSIPVGQFVALVGPSGAGKTTAIDLVVGLHRPQRGEIYVDDTPLAAVDLRAWRQSIGYVPQEMLLFNDTILHNITLGDPNISRADVEWALRAAGAWDFIAERAEGLDTEVGNLGVKISGGQRQRLAIARALVRRPRLLVLDEVTTALDPRTERAICETLRSLSGQVTIIAISHQPAIREAADISYRLAEGRVERLAASAATPDADDAPAALLATGAATAGVLG